MGSVVVGLLAGAPLRRSALEHAEPLASAVAANVARLDDEIAAAIEHWEPQRVGMIERTILRLALHELWTDRAPPRVVISEAVRLAHWFAGAKAPAFVNGVLDALARRAGRL